MNSNQRNSVKLLAAVIGGSAVVAMGALAMSINQEHSASDMVLADGMKLGQTITQAAGPNAMETPMAEPGIKAQGPQPFEGPQPLPAETNIPPTITQAAHAPTAIPTPMAVPEIKGSAPLPVEEQEADGDTTGTFQ